MIPTILRVIFDGKNACFRPESAMAEGFDNLAECEIIVRDVRRRCGRAGSSSAGVIVGQADDHQARKLAALLELLEIFYELRCSENIGHRHIPANGICVQVRP